MPAKEARDKLTVALLHINQLNLHIASQRNEIESLEGARRNLKMMYDTHEIEKNLAVKNAEDAEREKMLLAKAANREIEAAWNESTAVRKELQFYMAETPSATMVRAVKTILSNLKNYVFNFVNKIKSKFVK